MGNRKWTGRPARVVLLVAVAAAGGGAALAVASVPDSSGVINACVELQPGSTLPATTPGNVRLIDSPQQTCNTNPAGGVPEEAVTWNAAGPQGPTGAQGVAGQTITIAGETFTLSNGRTATVTQQPTIAPLQVNPGGPVIATLTLGSGAGAITSNVLGYSFNGPGASTSASRGAGSGKVKFNEFSITKKIDVSSPKLIEACASGQHYKTVTLALRKAGGVALTYEFNDVVIGSYQTSSADERPLESITLNFTSVTIRRRKSGGSGSSNQ